MMVLGVPLSEGDDMSLFFSEEGLRVNVHAYIRVIDSIIKPWMKSIAGDRHCILQ